MLERIKIGERASISVEELIIVELMEIHGWKERPVEKDKENQRACTRTFHKLKYLVLFYSMKRWVCRLNIHEDLQRLNQQLTLENIIKKTTEMGYIILLSKLEPKQLHKVLHILFAAWGKKFTATRILNGLFGVLTLGNWWN